MEWSVEQRAEEAADRVRHLYDDIFQVSPSPSPSLPPSLPPSPSPLSLSLSTPPREVDRRRKKGGDMLGAGGAAGGGAGAGCGRHLCPAPQVSNALAALPVRAAMLRARG
eukprot:3932781-Rhodomonas_salina.1